MNSKEINRRYLIERDEQLIKKGYLTQRRIK